MVAGISEGVAVAPPSRFTADGNADRLRDFAKNRQGVAKSGIFQRKESDVAKYGETKRKTRRCRAQRRRNYVRAER